MAASFSSFEQILEKAIADGILPGAVVAAKDKSGNLNYLKPFGNRSLTPGSEKPMTVDTIFPLASMTKLLTSIMALQLIDRNLITPDTDITPYLPVLASLPILKEFNPETGEEVTVPRTKPILFRHLLSHSSGLGYHFLSPILRSRAEYLIANGKPPAVGPGVSERYGSHPLLFEPGEDWNYGPGIDWAGHLVEVLTGLDLETYLRENVIQRLGLDPEKNIITFYPERLGTEGQERRMQMAYRDNNNRCVPLEGDPPLVNHDVGRAVYGGEAGHADLSVYVEVLGSLLRDDDERLLRRETKAKFLFEGLLREDGAKKGLVNVLRDPSWIVGFFPPGLGYDHSLGGVVVVDGEGEGEAGSSNRRKKGFLLWGGMYNLSWFIDREAGVTALFGTSVANPADPDIEKLFVALEEAVYAEAGASVNN